MTKVEREKMVVDKWPVFSEKNRDEFLRFIEDAPKAKIFEVDECEKNKKLTPC